MKRGPVKPPKADGPSESSSKLGKKKDHTSKERSQGETEGKVRDNLSD